MADWRGNATAAASSATLAVVNRAAVCRGRAIAAASRRKRSRARPGLDGARRAVEQEADLLAGGGKAGGRTDPVQGPALHGELARGRGETPFRGRSEPIGGPPQRAGHLEPVGHDDLGGGRRGGRADVGREIGQGHIDLVAHAAHHRHRVGHHGAHDPLIVEGPQVLERTAAPGEDRHRGRVLVAALLAAHRGVALDAAEGGHQARRGPLPLHPGRDQHDLDERPAAGQHVADVAPDRARRARDDGDRRGARPAGFACGPCRTVPPPRAVP